MKSDKCAHLLRASQAVNYISGDKLCFLHVELLSCMEKGCKQQFLMNPFKHQLIKHPTDESKVFLKWMMGEAEKARKAQESQIVKPETSIIT